MLKKSIIAMAMLGAGVLGLSGLSSTASAFAVPAQTSAQTAPESTLLTEVARRHVNRHVRYDRHRHGARCNRYGNNCRYRYNGYYYASPWWLLPAVGATVIIGSSNSGGRNRHEAWCYNNYRSYNERNNTWISYSGQVRQCVSPYRY
ncbi:BA14K family protein [Aestuariivirga sp.]|uniref:BA14K family protein n=1 Tax=Aestuariivirga sp. TaxID=2650926 RepID=UPI0035932AF7